MPHPFPHFEPPELAHRDVWRAQKASGTPFGSAASVPLLQTLLVLCPRWCSSWGARQVARLTFGAALPLPALQPDTVTRQRLNERKPAVLLSQC